MSVVRVESLIDRRGLSDLLDLGRPPKRLKEKRAKEM